MIVKVARSSGYCMGVRRAVEQALEAVNRKAGPIYAYGPLIHNPQAMALLEGKGLVTLKGGLESLEGIEGGTVIVRAHGIPPDERKALEDKGFDVIDATCPRVIRVQAIIDRHTSKGSAAIIWGNPDHPEVIGLMGHAHGRGYVITGQADLEKLPPLEKVIFVAQTTQHRSRMDKLVEAVKERWPDAEIFDTICGATQRRQDDVERLAREVEAIVIVGGHTSGNTRRLAAVAEAAGVKTVHIETEEELDPAWFKGVESVGVTAGASTPNWMIKRVIRQLERLARQGNPDLRTWTRRILRALILSNVYAALGAGLLCLAGAILQGIEPNRGYFGVTFFYVHAMHMLNLFLDKEASKFNDPDRAMFVESHKAILLSSGIFSAAVSLGLSFMLGRPVLALLFVMSGLGLLYALPLVPRPWTRFTRIRRLKDIPASKTLSLSGGWAVCLAFVPALAPEGRLSWSTGLVALIIFLMVFVRSALGDVLDVQGDRVVGRETIPIMIGEKRTLTLLDACTVAQAVLLLAGWAAGLLTSLALLLLACAAYSAFYLHLHRKEQVMGAWFFEGFIEANFILAGLLSWIWWGLGLI